MLITREREHRDTTVGLLIDAVMDSQVESTI